MDEGKFRATNDAARWRRPINWRISFLLQEKEELRRLRRLCVIKSNGYGDVVGCITRQNRGGSELEGAGVVVARKEAVRTLSVKHSSDPKRILRRHLLNNFDHLHHTELLYVTDVSGYRASESHSIEPLFWLYPSPTCFVVSFGASAVEEGPIFGP